MLYAAGKVQAKVEMCTTYVMDAEHCLVSGVKGVVEEMLAPMHGLLQEIRQQQRVEGRAEAEGALAHPHALPPSPAPAPDTPDAVESLMVADEPAPLIPKQELSLAFPIEYYTMQEAWGRLVELQQVRYTSCQFSMGQCSPSMGTASVGSCQRALFAAAGLTPCCPDAGEQEGAASQRQPAAV